MFDSAISVLEGQAEMVEAMDTAFRELKDLLTKNATGISDDDLPELSLNETPVHGKSDTHIIGENKYLLNPV